MHVGGCRRDVLVGKSEILDKLPPLSPEEGTIYQDVPAYAHLLTYMTGLISRTRGESQIVSQFRNAYEDLKGRNSSAARSMRPMFQSLIHDNSIIRSSITRGLKPAFYEACAHELSGQNGPDTVMVLANANKKGSKPDEVTENIVRYLGNNRKKAADTIIFTHPDNAVLKNIYSSFLSQKMRGRISCAVKMLPFDEAFDSTADLLAMKQVFVCYPMGVDEKVDRRVLEEWRQKEALGGKLIHLGGGTKAQRQSVGLWSDPGLFYYVSPEEIVSWQTKRQKTNEETIKKGIEACEVCADIRGNGNKRPNAKIILQKLQAL